MMKTEKGKSKKKRRQQSSSESSASSDEDSSRDSSSDESVKKKPKRRSSSEGSEVTRRKKTKDDAKRRRRDSDTSSSRDDEKRRKRTVQRIDKEDVAHVRVPKERASENDSRLKRSRRELESSKWDSPVDKIPRRRDDRSSSPPAPRRSRDGDDRRKRNRERFHDDARRPDRDDRKRDRDDGRRTRDGRRGSRDRDRNRDGFEFRKSRFSKRDSQDGDYEWGGPGRSEGGGPSDPKKPKEKPDFGLSGKLTEDTNTYRGVVIKYSEPPEAYKPKRRWRLYPFKGEKAMQTLYIHRETAYLLGRERKVVDIPLDHPSCSKQHAALQYRLVPFERPDGSVGKRVRPYVIDLGSANGTFLNNVKIEPRKYVELFEKDVLKFGYSTREYVLLHENSKDEAQDDDVKEEEIKEEKDVAPAIKKEKLEPMEPIVPQEVSIG